MLRFLSGLSLLSALMAFAALSQTAPSDAAEYVGSRNCALCHEAIDRDVARSGHPAKVQKIDGNPPAYPGGTSPGVPVPPDGMTWADVSYVIGGYGWKARFMDREGYVLTGPEDRQYNLANRALGLPADWVGYDAGTAPRKPYTCGACHTTGWVATGPDGPHQDGLPGIHGTWAEPGVTCEACHGLGSAHVADPRNSELAVAENCGSCHVRGDVSRIDASGGLVKHHEQYEDLLASPHSTIGCTACHDPHKSAVYGEGFKREEKTCRACHAAQANLAVAPKAHSACTSCHMPPAGKSAVSITLETKDGPLPVGDIRSHIFRINTDPGWQMFSDDGKFVRLDHAGRAHLSPKYACLRCHRDRNSAWAGEFAKRMHLPN